MKKADLAVISSKTKGKLRIAGLLGLFLSILFTSSCRFLKNPQPSQLAQDRFGIGPFDPNIRGGLFIHAFDATPREVRIGEPTEITWFAPLADTVEIVGIAGDLPPTGSRTFWPSETRTYQMIARRQEGGRQMQASRFLTIFAEKVIGPPRIWSFRPERNGVEPNEVVNLRYRVGGCTWIRIWAPNGFSGEKECMTEEDVLPVNTPVTMTYTLELLNSRRELITLSQTTLDIVERPRMPVITRFETGDPSRMIIDAGTPITIFWETAEATQVRINPDPSFVGSLPDLARLPPSGRLEARPMTDTTYTITAVNGSQTTSRQLRIQVSPLPHILEFAATPQRVPHLGQTVVKWNIANCKEAQLSAPQFSEKIPCQGSKAFSVSSTVSFQLLAVSPTGQSVTRDFIVVADPPQVPPPQPVPATINVFAASATRIPHGEAITLTWSTQNAQRITIEGLPNPNVAATGQLRIIPRQSMTLTLKVFGAGQNEPQQIWPLVLEVFEPNLKIISFKAEKNRVPIGGTVHLSWEVVGCKSVKIYSLNVSSSKPLFAAEQSCSGSFKAPVKRGTTFRLVTAGSQNQVQHAEIVVLAGQDDVDGWFNMLLQVPEDEQ